MYQQKTIKISETSRFGRVLLSAEIYYKWLSLNPVEKIDTDYGDIRKTDSEISGLIIQYFKAMEFYLDDIYQKNKKNIDAEIRNYFSKNSIKNEWFTIFKDCRGIDINTKELRNITIDKKSKIEPLSQRKIYFVQKEINDNFKFYKDIVCSGREYYTSKSYFMNLFSILFIYSKIRNMKTENLFVNLFNCNYELRNPAAHKNIINYDEIEKSRNSIKSIIIGLYTYF